MTILEGAFCRICIAAWGMEVHPRQREQPHVQAVTPSCCQVDGCYADPKQYAEQYPLLGKYLNKPGRAITYSCSWPAYLPDPTKTKFQVQT